MNELFARTALGDDALGRRINRHDPDASLLLQKPSGGQPHEGGLTVDMIARQVLRSGQVMPVWATLALLLTLTMLLSGVMNNAATVVLMAPIAIGVARGLHVSPDPFLMTIAVQFTVDGVIETTTGR